MASVVSGARVDTGEVRVSAGLYRKKGVVVFPLTKYTTKEGLMAAINSLKIKRGTFTNAAHGLDAVRKKMLIPGAGDRPDSPNVVIVITDAESTADVKAIPKASQMLKKTGVQVYAVGLHLEHGSEELLMMASRPGDAFSIPDISGFPGIRETIVNQIYARKEGDKSQHRELFSH